MNLSARDLPLHAQLEHAWALIDDESKFTKGALYRDKDNNSITMSSPNVCKFCSVGAIKFTGLWWTTDLYGIQRQNIAIVNILKDAMEECGLPIMTIPDFNDSHSYEQVRHVWMKAIQLAKKGIQ